MKITGFFSACFLVSAKLLPERKSIPQSDVDKTFCFVIFFYNQIQKSKINVESLNFLISW